MAGLPRKAQFEQVTKRRLNVTGEGSAEQGQRHREETIDRIGSDLVVKQSLVKKHSTGRVEALDC